MVRSPAGVSRFPYPAAAGRKPQAKAGEKLAAVNPAERARSRDKPKAAS
jgi:hypothetical protein